MKRPSPDVMNTIDQQSPDSAVNTVRTRATRVLIILGASLIPTIYSLTIALSFSTLTSNTICESVNNIIDTTLLSGHKGLSNTRSIVQASTKSCAMKRFFQEASEAEEIPYESKQSQHWRRTRLTSQGLTTSVTTSTSPWMDTNRSPDTSFVNTVTQATLPVVQTKKDPHSTYISVLTRSMSPTDKVDSWFSSTPAGPSQSSTSRPNTRDTAMTSIAGEQSQPSNQTTGETFLGPTTTGASPQDLFLDSFVDNQSQLPDAQMDANITIPGSLNTNLSRPSISGLGTTDSFFDSVPKGPSQLSTSRWNARAPTFNPWNSTRKQAPTSPCNKPETSVIRGKHP